MSAQSTYWGVKYDLFLEHDPQTGHFTATVAGLPGIIVDAKTQASAIKMAKEAIQFHLDESNAPPPSRPIDGKVVSVEV